MRTRRDGGEPLAGFIMESEATRTPAGPLEDAPLHSRCLQRLLNLGAVCLGSFPHGSGPAQGFSLFKVQLLLWQQMLRLNLGQQFDLYVQLDGGSGVCF